ncbi:hypothetical protein C7999DRAFT_12980 [Corynascus novoguineensis]|uniref:Uncharacterized protein n=1 Tax=Corynascus novoguineensis TaxID=1126955 RepID=A0AAN7CYD3_9PEZI|nr:hypothetical protein C7999DRAFT_12980 [Corynascus novoguineensis]
MDGPGKVLHLGRRSGGHAAVTPLLSGDRPLSRSGSSSSKAKKRHHRDRDKLSVTKQTKEDVWIRLESDGRVFEFRVSPLRWKAACLVYDVKRLFPRGTTTEFLAPSGALDALHHTSHDQTFLSLTNAPPVLFSAVVHAILSRITELLSNIFGGLYTPIFTNPSSNAFPSPPPPPTSRPQQPNQQQHIDPVDRQILPIIRTYPGLNELTILLLFFYSPSRSKTISGDGNTRPTTTSSSYRRAIMHLVIAATLNHVRRVLFPGIMGGNHHHLCCAATGDDGGSPLEDLRLAMSNPDVFVAAALAGCSGGGGRRGWWEWLGWFLQAAGGGLLVKWAVDLAIGSVFKKLLLSAVVVDAGWAREMKERDINERARRNQHHARLAVVKVGYLVWLLVTVEYAFTRAVNAAAWLVACCKSLSGEEMGRLASRKAMERKRLEGSLVICQVVHYLMTRFGPLLWRSSQSAGRGQPGSLLALMGIVWGVWILLRYRSTFFIALQVSGVFVFLGYLLVGFSVFGREFFQDPLGIKVQLALTNPDRRNQGGNLGRTLR